MHNILMMIIVMMVMMLMMMVTMIILFFSLDFRTVVIQPTIVQRTLGSATVRCCQGRHETPRLPVCLKGSKMQQSKGGGKLQREDPPQE